MGGLKILHCGNLDCTSGNTITTVDSVTPSYGSPFTRSSLAIGSDGLPVVSYYDSNNYKLKILHCGNLDCTSGNKITVVDPNSQNGLGSSLAIGSDGLPVVSYYSQAYPHYDLKILHCGNLDCTSGNKITVVDNGDLVTGAHYYHSLIINYPGGLPLLSYHLASSYSAVPLKILQCGNLDCTSGNKITVVDPGSSYTYYSSIAIGSDDLPLIPYVKSFGAAGKWVNVLHCGNAACTSGNTITSGVVDTKYLNDVGVADTYF